jgi:hypothetical protein
MAVKSNTETESRGRAVATSSQMTSRTGTSRLLPQSPWNSLIGLQSVSCRFPLSSSSAVNRCTDAIGRPSENIVRHPVSLLLWHWHARICPPAVRAQELTTSSPSAILTKYTSLRSFHEQTVKGSPLDYEIAGIYTNALLDAYVEYKSMWGDLNQSTNITLSLRPPERC